MVSTMYHACIGLRRLDGNDIDRGGLPNPSARGRVAGPLQLAIARSFRTRSMMLSVKPNQR